MRDALALGGHCQAVNCLLQREEYLANEGLVKTTGCKIVQHRAFDFCQMKSDACILKVLRNL